MQVPHAMTLSPFEPLSFEQLPKQKQGSLNPTDYETKRKAYLNDPVRSSQFFSFHYSSNGIQVPGFFYGHRDKQKAHPTIVFNRGGNQDLGTVDFQFTPRFQRYLESGFLTIGTQYRGTTHESGQDEFGGKDLQDIFSLLSLTRSLPFVDSSKLFMIGVSRGGMMTYQCIRDGFPIRAAATVSATSDLFLEASLRPDMERYVFQKLIPNYAIGKEHELRSRSAAFWPEKLTVPLLMLHGDSDKQVDLSHTTKLQSLLEPESQSFKMSVFEGGNHGLNNFALQRDAECCAWFQKYLA